ncbi:MAG TPA: glutamate-cysteine ligase family protein [Myxococcota bacterium]
MSTINPHDVDDPGQPLRGVDELIETFVTAEKPRSAFRVGTEHEKFGFVRGADGVVSPLPYDGPQGIEAILTAIADDPIEKASTTWTPAFDHGRVIALFGDNKASITLEPGGQFELSGAPLATIHEVADETDAHLALLQRIAGARGVGFIGMGFQPTSTWAALPLVPKERYGIMQRYMPTVGHRGLDMMKRTATVQANYDWADEAHMVQSYRMALAVSPLISALFASGPFYEGKPSGVVSERQLVWSDTDPDRSGYPQVVFDDGFSYETYVEWVLSVPMYFVRRNGQHHDVAGASFRTFMTDGLDVDGVRVKATLRDWADHLTTLFPEVRMKRVLEVRSADCGPRDRIIALPALYKGLLYDDMASAAALALMDSPSSRELAAFRTAIAREGFKATYRGRSAQALSEQLLDIASAGLARLGATNAAGDDERRYLAPLVDSVSRGATFADDLLARYRGAWNGDITRIWDELSFYAF